MTLETTPMHPAHGVAEACADVAAEKLAVAAARPRRVGPLTEVEILALSSREELRTRDNEKIRELLERLQELRVLGMQRVREAHASILRGRGDELPQAADSKTVREASGVWIEVSPPAAKP